MAMSSILLPVVVTDGLLGRSVRRMVALACKPCTAHPMAFIAVITSAAVAQHTRTRWHETHTMGRGGMQNRFTGSWLTVCSYVQLTRDRLAAREEGGAQHMLVAGGGSTSED